MDRWIYPEPKVKTRTNKPSSEHWTPSYSKPRKGSLKKCCVFKIRRDLAKSLWRKKTRRKLGCWAGFLGVGDSKKNTPSVFGFQVTLHGMLLRAEWYPFTPLWKCQGVHHETGQQCQRQHRVRISAVRHDFFLSGLLEPLGNAAKSEFRRPIFRLWADNVPTANLQKTSEQWKKGPGLFRVYRA